ncbi:HIT-like domain [Trinorchestia longiramus]|nr:HIT-like domain [Trinorchestia longiramus]
MPAPSPGCLQSFSQLTDLPPSWSTGERIRLRAEDPGSNPAAAMVDAARITAWDLELPSVPQQATENGKLQYSVWPAFSYPNHSAEDFHKCWSSDVTFKVEDMLVRQLEGLRSSQQSLCSHLMSSIESTYRISARSSTELRLPPVFAALVHTWLGNDSALVRELHHQLVVHVSQRMTGEHVVYNHLRGRRPTPPVLESAQTLVNRLSLQTWRACNFCNARQRTASDSFLRHETNASIRVSNAFKLERWHLMVVTRPPHHHPTNFSRSLYTAFLSDAVALALEIIEVEPTMRYPHIAWDTLPRAGASQVHPHIHVLASPHAFYGHTELLREAGEIHYRNTGGNLFSTLLEIHTALNLTAHHGNAAALAMLSGKGDLEVMLLSDSPNDDLYNLLYFVTKAYHDSFQQYCYSMVLSWTRPEDASVAALPAVARIVGRGQCGSSTSDRSSFELFQAVYRQHDPWQLIQAVREAIHKYA